MKMPDELWAWKPDILHGEFTASSKCHKAPAVEYRRADLPKEVDFDKIRQWDFYECADCKAMHQEELTTCDCHTTGVSKYTKRTMVDLNDLVALGVIKDINVKPAENKADRSET